MIKGKADFPAVWKNDYVKPAFKKMTAGYCSYCQSPGAACEHGRIDHFRPKSLFPSLAYDWKNYFYCCELCNHTKSDKWPDSGEYVRPDRGDPSSRFEFKKNGEIVAIASDLEAKRTIENLGLNRPDLKKERSVAIKGPVEDVQDLVRAVKKGSRPATEAKKHVKRLLRRFQKPGPYSAAIHQNVRRVWNDAFPQHLL
ncbi:MAG TPA: retron system putative HNH endonuclease [Myxococcaceae bacterium]|nr:retron system putative HNH endonuclease [Myxococcaceae bacterium]